MPLTPFLVATGFLAAILLVWGQLWVSSYPAEDVPETVYLGLIWTYLAVVVALAAFAWAGWSWSREDFGKDFRVPDWPFGLLVATLIMAGINVGQSIISVAIKLIREDVLITQPLIKLVTVEARVGGIVFVFLIAAFIIGMSWWGTKNHRFWMIEVVFLIVLGTTLYVLILKFSYIFYPHVVLSSLFNLIT